MKSFINSSIIAIGLMSCAKEVKLPTKESKIKINITNTGDGDEELHSHQGREHLFVTANNDSVRFETFKYYISNIMFVNSATGVSYKVPNSYYLFGYENSTSLKPEGVTLPIIPNGTYTHITFGIGVDNSANATTAKQGELDPNAGMAWNWDSGYKFVVIEGNYVFNVNSTSGIVFHIGKNENYKTKTLELPNGGLTVGLNTNATINLKANVSKAFSGMYAITRKGATTVPGTVMGGINATSIAGNYAMGMFSITNITY